MLFIRNVFGGVLKKEPAGACQKREAGRMVGKAGEVPAEDVLSVKQAGRYSVEAQANPEDLQRTDVESSATTGRATIITSVNKALAMLAQLPIPRSRRRIDRVLLSTQSFDCGLEVA